MPMRLVSLAFCLALAATSAAAEPLDWVKSPAEMSAVSQLGAGVSAAMICNHGLNLEAARAFLDRNLGTDRHYTNTQAADLLLVVAGTHGLQEQLMKADARSTRTRYCKTAGESFGPAGTVIPGLLQ